MLSYTLAASLITDKRSLYETLQLNQYVLPPLDGPFVTSKLMAGIYHGTHWMLKSDNVSNYKVCAFPPNKQILADTLHAAMVNC